MTSTRSSADLPSGDLPSGDLTSADPLPGDLPYGDLLTLIDGRSAVFRAAVAAAPDLSARVPGCPDWTLADLVEHVGGVQRFWAVVVSAADETGPPSREKTDFDSPTGDLVEWSAESTRLLLDALSAAGPESPSWAWWAASGTPLTALSVARHQVQEVAVHAYDAQATIGQPEPLPAAIAVDGVPEFLSVGLASRGPWPNRPARLTFTAIDGPTHVVDLSPSGVSLDPAPAGEPLVTVHAPASDLVLALYNRIPLTSLHVDGDPGPLHELRSWIAG
jgi:uncharacterized protein (TIGR03083 family)